MPAPLPPYRLHAPVPGSCLSPLPAPICKADSSPRASLGISRVLLASFLSFSFASPSLAQHPCVGPSPVYPGSPRGARGSARRSSSRQQSRRYPTDLCSEPSPSQLLPVPTQMPGLLPGVSSLWGGVGPWHPFSCLRLGCGVSEGAEGRVLLCWDSPVLPEERSRLCSGAESWSWTRANHNFSL